MAESEKSQGTKPPDKPKPDQTAGETGIPGTGVPDPPDPNKPQKPDDLKTGKI